MTTLELTMRLRRTLHFLPFREIFVLNPEEENDSNINIVILKRNDQIRNQKRTSSNKGVTCPRYNRISSRSN